MDGSRLRVSCLVLAGSACQPDSPGGGPPAQITTAPGTELTGTSTGGPSSSGPAEESVGGEGSFGEVGSTSGPRLDVGGSPDLASEKPLGCGGKIDFLFLISRHPHMVLPPENKPWLGTTHQRLIEAFPKFLQTIEAKFPDFDYHIMVVDGDPFWGTLSCSESCAEPICAEVEGYPCDQLDEVTPCDQTWGAGLVFNAGWEAENKPCDLPPNRRYLVKGDPSPEETFACMSNTGAGGYDFLNEALMATMSEELNGDGGCNEGFIRDDALLMVTFIQNTGDNESKGDVWDWWKSVRVAKHEDLEAVVMFVINQAEDLEDCLTQKPDVDRNCELIRKFPYRDQVNIWEYDFGPAFDRATDLLVTACEGFVPVPN